MKVICISNQKGGTGKTTLCALLSYSLYKLGYRVLMVDLDPQAHLSSFFIKVNQLDYHPGFLELARGQKFKIHALSKDKKLCLIPSKLGYLVEAYKGSLPTVDSHAIDRRFRTEPVIQKFDYVILDTPPELFAPTVWAFYASNFLLIPVNYEELSLMGSKILIKDVLPDVFAVKDLKVLGLVFINVVARVSSSSLTYISDRLKDFIRNNIPKVFHSYFYDPPVFNSVIHRRSSLRDLMYRPKRRSIPLERIFNSDHELQSESMTFANEFISRINNFRGLS